MYSQKYSNTPFKAHENNFYNDKFPKGATDLTNNISLSQFPNQDQINRYRNGANARNMSLEYVSQSGKDIDENQRSKNIWDYGVLVPENQLYRGKQFTDQRQSKSDSNGENTKTMSSEFMSNIEKSSDETQRKKKSWEYSSLLSENQLCEGNQFSDQGQSRTYSNGENIRSMSSEYMSHIEKSTDENQRKTKLWEYGLLVPEKQIYQGNQVSKQAYTNAENTKNMFNLDNDENQGQKNIWTFSMPQNQDINRIYQNNLNIPAPNLENSLYDGAQNSLNNVSSPQILSRFASQENSQKLRYGSPINTSLLYRFKKSIKFSDEEESERSQLYRDSLNKSSDYTHLKRNTTSSHKNTLNNVHNLKKSDRKETERSEFQNDEVHTNLENNAMVSYKNTQFDDVNNAILSDRENVEMPQFQHDQVNKNLSYTNLDNNGAASYKNTQFDNANNVILSDQENLERSQFQRDKVNKSLSCSNLENNAIDSYKKTQLNNAPSTSFSGREDSQRSQNQLDKLNKTYENASSYNENSSDLNLSDTEGLKTSSFPQDKLNKNSSYSYLKNNTLSRYKPAQFKNGANLTFSGTDDTESPKFQRNNINKSSNNTHLKSYHKNVPFNMGTTQTENIYQNSSSLEKSKSNIQLPTTSNILNRSALQMNGSSFQIQNAKKVTSTSDSASYESNTHNTQKNQISTPSKRSEIELQNASTTPKKFVQSIFSLENLQVRLNKSNTTDSDNKNGILFGKNSPKLTKNQSSIRSSEIHDNDSNKIIEVSSSQRYVTDNSKSRKQFPYLQQHQESSCNNTTISSIDEFNFFLKYKPKMVSSTPKPQRFKEKIYNSNDNILENNTSFEKTSFIYKTLSPAEDFSKIIQDNKDFLEKLKIKSKSNNAKDSNYSRNIPKQAEDDKNIKNVDPHNEQTKITPVNTAHMNQNILPESYSKQNVPLVAEQSKIIPVNLAQSNTSSVSNETSFELKNNELKSPRSIDEITTQKKSFVPNNPQTASVDELKNLSRSLNNSKTNKSISHINSQKNTASDVEIIVINSDVQSSEDSDSYVSIIDLDETSEINQTDLNSKTKANCMVGTSSTHNQKINTSKSMLQNCTEESYKETLMKANKSVSTAEKSSISDSIYNSYEVEIRNNSKELLTRETKVDLNINKMAEEGKSSSIDTEILKPQKNCNVNTVCNIATYNQPFKNDYDNKKLKRPQMVNENTKTSKNLWTKDNVQRKIVDRYRESTNKSIQKPKPQINVEDSFKSAKSQNIKSPYEAFPKNINANFSLPKSPGIPKQKEALNLDKNAKEAPDLDTSISSIFSTVSDNKFFSNLPTHPAKTSTPKRRKIDETNKENDVYRESIIPQEPNKNAVPSIENIKRDIVSKNTTSSKCILRKPILSTSIASNVSFKSALSSLSICAESPILIKRNLDCQSKRQAETNEFSGGVKKMKNSNLPGPSTSALPCVIPTRKQIASREVLYVGKRDYQNKMVLRKATDQEKKKKIRNVKKLIDEYITDVVKNTMIRDNTSEEKDSQ